MFNEYDVVRLKRDMPSHGLVAGTRGTIVVVYEDPHLPRAYEVEFVNAKGKTLAIVTLKENDLEVVTDNN